MGTQGASIAILAIVLLGTAFCILVSKAERHECLETRQMIIGASDDTMVPFDMCIRYADEAGKASPGQ